MIEGREGVLGGTLGSPYKYLFNIYNETSCS
jgi:hypothetical protein